MPDGRQIAVLAVHHGPPNGFDQVWRGLKSERHGIADIQVPDGAAARLDLRASAAMFRMA